MKEHGWRRRDLDRGKTLAILLVVFGHLVAREDPSGGGGGAAWYEPARAAVYAFHIPFLFYLSGYAAQWSGSTAARGAAYRELLCRRAYRLLLPAFVFGVAILAGKMTVVDVMHVDHAPASFMGGLSDLIWRTDRSPAQSVWYLIVLFVYAAGAPVLLLPPLRRYGPALLVALAPLAILPVPPILYADRVITYVPFFFAGMVAADDDYAWCRWIDDWRVPLAVLLAGALWLDLRWGAAVPRNVAMLGVSLVALPALHAMVRRLPVVALRLLDPLVPYAFAIYLLNTSFIGLAKALLMKQLPWDGAWFPLFAVVLMVAGVLGPVAARMLVFRPVPLLDRLTR